MEVSAEPESHWESEVTDTGRVDGFGRDSGYSYNHNVIKLVRLERQSLRLRECLQRDQGALKASIKPTDVQKQDQTHPQR